MIIVKNNIIPFKGFKLITLWPFIFTRGSTKLSDIDRNHEEIHGRQQLELLLVFFYLLYYGEYLVRWIKCGNRKKAYKNISFEQEAYYYESNLAYLKFRPFWAWLQFLRKWSS